MNLLKKVDWQRIGIATFGFLTVASLARPEDLDLLPPSIKPYAFKFCAFSALIIRYWGAIFTPPVKKDNLNEN